MTITHLKVRFTEQIPSCTADSRLGGNSCLSFNRGVRQPAAELTHLIICSHSSTPTTASFPSKRESFLFRRRARVYAFLWINAHKCGCACFKTFSHAAHTLRVMLTLSLQRACFHTVTERNSAAVSLCNLVSNLFMCQTFHIV